MVGALSSTVTVALGTAAGALLPAVSVAVPAVTLMPSVELSEMPERVRVLVGPLPVTPTDEAAAEPVAFTVMLAGANVLELRSEERCVGKEGRSRWAPYH